MKTNASKRSSQELQALRLSPSSDLILPLRPLVPENKEPSETDPYYLRWYVAGRPVSQ